MHQRTVGDEAGGFVNELSGSTSVVTGGAGFVGSHVCDALLERAGRVICVDNLVGSQGSTRNVDHLADNPNFELITESVVDWAAAADLTGVDYVFHQAASKMTVCMRDPELDLTVNALGTLRLLRAAARGGVKKFVHGSTGSVFGRLEEQQDELHPTRPVSFYGVSKLAGESYCRVIGELEDLDYTVFRYYHVIGPRQDDSDTGGVVPIFVRRCAERQPVTIYGTGEQIRSFTSVFDVVKANLRAAELGRQATGFINCASGIRVSIQELADFIRGEMDCNDQEIVYEDWRPGDIKVFNIDNSKARELLEMEFDTDWKEVVRGVIRAHRETTGAQA
jgi:nucleoside-diphosphate-sugar epimerase